MTSKVFARLLGLFIVLLVLYTVASAVVFLGEGMTARDVLGAVLVGSSVVYFAVADHRGAAAQVDGGEAVHRLTAPGSRVTS